ncbi:hypothetical protein LZ31DRAFT_552332 [Colletotrichum somersetense]|nr:hypothetical protein LZ31DRAFT_552332 [Colletotrichum somersetense]
MTVPICRATLSLAFHLPLPASDKDNVSACHNSKDARAQALERGTCSFPSHRDTRHRLEFPLDADDAD